MEMKAAYIGIDWSITSPAVTILHSDGTIVIHAISPFERDHKMTEQHVTIVLHPYPLYVTDQERFRGLADLFAPLITAVPDSIVALENYAFSRQPSRMMQIAECTGLLKDRLPKFVTLTSTTVKKYATGSGRADKIDMLDKFTEATGVDLFMLFGYKRTKSIKQPLTDIADSFWIARCLADKFSA